MSVKSTVLACCPSVLKPMLDRIENSPIGYRLAKGVFWSMAGAMISRGLMLVASIVVARMLGIEVYGEYGMIRSTVGMFGIFAGFGLGLTATKHVAEFRDSVPQRAGRIIGMAGLFAMLAGGLMALGLFVFAPWLAEHTINAPHLAGVLRIGAVILFINALNGAQTGALSGFEAFKAIAQVNFFVGLISFPVLICGAWFGGLTGAVWALAINFAFNWLLNHIALRKEARRHNVPFTFRNCSREWPILWKFSLPAVMSSSLVGPVNWACGALLVNQYDGYAQMGIYSAANQWRVAILFLPAMLGQVVLPILSNLNAESSGKQYRKVLILNILLNTGIALAVVFPLVLLARYIMSSYGPGFEDGTGVLRFLSFSAVLAAGTSVIGHAIASKDRMWMGFTFNALWAIALFTMTSLFLFKGYGALGLAYATLIAYALHAAWQSVYLAAILRRNGNTPDTEELSLNDDLKN
jgi:O-antigen/teichoic acid export membrane protein